MVKQLKKRKLDFNDLGFDWVDESLIVAKAKGSDSVLIGGKVIEIDGFPSKDLMGQYKNTFSSDGYNTTFSNRFIALNFGNFYRKHQGYLDSVSLKIKLLDSLIIRKYNRYLEKEKPKSEKVMDSVAGKAIAKLSNEERFAKKKRAVNKKKTYPNLVIFPDEINLPEILLLWILPNILRT